MSCVDWSVGRSVDQVSICTTDRAVSVCDKGSSPPPCDTNDGMSSPWLLPRTSQPHQSPSLRWTQAIESSSLQLFLTDEEKLFDDSDRSLTLLKTLGQSGNKMRSKNTEVHQNMLDRHLTLLACLLLCDLFACVLQQLEKASVRSVDHDLRIGELSHSTSCHELSSHVQSHATDGSEPQPSGASCACCELDPSPSSPPCSHHSHEGGYKASPLGREKTSINKEDQQDCTAKASCSSLVHKEPH